MIYKMLELTGEKTSFCPRSSYIYPWCLKVCCVCLLSCAQLFWNSMVCSPLCSSVHGISKARILERGCHFLLQGIFPTLGLNLHLLWLLHWQVDSLPLHHLGCPQVFIYSAAAALNCSVRDLVPWPGMEPGPPALGVWRLNHWTTRGVPEIC